MDLCRAIIPEPPPQLPGVNQHAIGWPAWLLCMWELRDCWTIVRIQCIVFLAAFLKQVWAATFQLPRAALQQCLASIPCTSFLPRPKPNPPQTSQWNEGADRRRSHRRRNSGSMLRPKSPLPPLSQKTVLSKWSSSPFQVFAKATVSVFPPRACLVFCSQAECCLGDHRMSKLDAPRIVCTQGCEHAEHGEGARAG